jgi:hypothetical protein
MSDREINGFHSASDMIKVAGVGFMHRLVNFGLAFLCLFFFYKDGEVLNRQITAIGSRWFGEARWSHYAQKIPTAIRATVNGLVLVGLAEGVLIGIGYALAGLPSAALWAAATGILAIIPFGAPLAFLARPVCWPSMAPFRRRLRWRPGAAWCYSSRITLYGPASLAMPRGCHSWPYCSAYSAGWKPWAWLDCLSVRW